MLPQKRYSACQRCSRRQAYARVILHLKSRFRLLYPSSHPRLGDLSPACYSLPAPSLLRESHDAPSEALHGGRYSCRLRHCAGEKRQFRRKRCVEVHPVTALQA